MRFIVDDLKRIAYVIQELDGVELHIVHQCIGIGNQNMYSIYSLTKQQYYKIVISPAFVIRW